MPPLPKKRPALLWLAPLALLLMPPLQGAPGQKLSQSDPQPSTLTGPRDTPWESIPPEIDWPRWNRDRGELTDISSWYDQVKTGGREDHRRFKGAFAIGNGAAFGMLGLSSPLNTLFNHAGPTYQQAQNFFGEAAITLTQGGLDVPFDEEWAYRFRGTGIIGTRGISQGGIALSTVDFAPMGAGFEALAPALLRVVIVENTGGSAALDVGINASIFYDREEAPTFEGSSLVQVRGERHCYLQAKPLESGARVSFEDAALRLDLGDLGPGEERVLALGLSYHLGPNPTSADTTLSQLTSDLDATLSQTLQAWRTKLNEGAQLHSDNERLDDLYEGMIAAILTQRAPEGAISPMNRYTKAWLRDTIGPLRLFARTGRLNDAQAMLDYLYKGAQLYGEIRNSYALGLPLNDLPPLEDPATFWANAPLMPGRNPTEAPSYLPLQYHFLYRHSADGPWLAERYHYLKRAMEGQLIEEGGRMPFSGDETFRVPLAAALSTPRDPTDVAWSANSSFAYVAALEDLAELAAYLGEGDDALAFHDEANLRRAQTDALYRLDGGSYGPVRFFQGDTLHPYPFEDIATKPLFFGYSDASDPATLEDVDALVTLLMRRDGTLLTPDGIAGALENPIYTGMVPGLSLATLNAVDHPKAPLAFDALALTASPSGMWQEMHWKDHSAAVATYSPSGRGASEVSARYRPWEGGENIDGLVSFLTGAELNLPEDQLSLSPRLPLWLSSYTFEALPLGPDGRYDLTIERIPGPGGTGTWRGSITLRGEGAGSLDITFLEPGAAWDSPLVNGQPWAFTHQSSPYPGQHRITLEAIPLSAGSPLELEISFSSGEL